MCYRGQGGRGFVLPVAGRGEGQGRCSVCCLGQGGGGGVNWGRDGRGWEGMGGGGLCVAWGREG